MEIDVKLSGVKLSDVANRVERLAQRVVSDGIKELNSGGRAMRAGIIPVLATQAGLKPGTINRFLREKAAYVGRPFYELSGSGGDIRDKFFRPRETSSGVDIMPRGVPVSVKGAFLKGGSPSNRVALSMGNNVFKRAGNRRLKILTQHSGVFIAEEMTKGGTLRYIEDSAARIGASIVRSFTSETL